MTNTDTTERIDHVAKANRIIAEGERAVAKVREEHDRGNYNLADDYGKKAMGCWAQAQVHATLALVEQQRIANIVRTGEHLTPSCPVDRERIAPEIREGLGL
ncbi:hypothetical protein [Microbacterium sp. KNMS]